MGLLVNATAEKKILINGTEIEIPSVYARLEYMCPQDGKTLYIGLHIYNSKEAYKNGAKEVLTDLLILNFGIELQADEEQGLKSAEAYSKAKYEELGYIVTII